MQGQSSLNLQSLGSDTYQKANKDEMNIKQEFGGLEKDIDGLESLADVNDPFNCHLISSPKPAEAVFNLTHVKKICQAK